MNPTLKTVSLAVDLLPVSPTKWALRTACGHLADAQRAREAGDLDTARAYLAAARRAARRAVAGL